MLKSDISGVIWWIKELFTQVKQQGWGEGIGGSRTACTKIIEAKKNNDSEMLGKRGNMVNAEAEEAEKSRTRSGKTMCESGIET